MKNNKLILFLIIMSLISFPNSFAADLDIEIMVKDSFTAGERLFFNYTIYSLSYETITFTPFINCPNAPTPILKRKTIDLYLNQPFTAAFYGITLDKSIEPQTCAAIIQISNPAQIVEQQNFTINTNPGFSFEIKTCIDQGCTRPSKTFIKNQDIYLSLESEVSNPTIMGILTFPDKTTQQLTLPTSIKAEQIGTYILEVAASKQGYKTVTDTTQFAVIEKEAEIQLASVCNANGVCDGNENSQNCPQDCPVSKKTSKFLIFIYVLVIVLIIIIAIIIIRKQRKNTNNNNLKKNIMIKPNAARIPRTYRDKKGNEYVYINKQWYRKPRQRET